jgi:hypothetical protein
VSARVPRVPLEDVAVGSKVRVWRWDREGDEGIAGVVTFQGKRHWRDAQSITGLDDDDVGFIHGRWLAEVIAPPDCAEPCKSCETRGRSGFDGQCPACANERARTVAPRIAPPDCAPQHPMAEEVPWPSSASFVHTCTDGIARVVCDQCTPDSRDAEISRLRADLAYHDRQAALRDAATGKVAGHAEQCACHGCVTGPLEREVERLTSERDEYKAKAEALAEILAAAMVEEDAAGCGA